MSGRTKLGIVAGLVVVIVGGLVLMGAQRRANAAVEVRLAEVSRRDLVSSVTASGKIEPKTSVDISADITGRIIDIAIEEGDTVSKGQYLLQIDPTQYQAAVARAEALVASNQAGLAQAAANRDQAERNLKRARELAASSPNLISDEAIEQAKTAFEVAEANYNASLAQVEQSRASLQEARDNLGKTRIVAPMSGRVVRLAVEEGEMAVPSTFSRDVGLLMTIADLSEILAKVQVDETDVVRLSRGDSVEITIDAFPDTTFVGRVTEISQSAQIAATETPSGSSGEAVDFDVEIALVAPPADIRPDLSATAKIITDTRDDALSIPIIALTVRPHQVVPTEANPAPAADSAPPRMEDREGVFVVHEGIANFRPVEVGIVGEEHFEILGGVEVGDTIVAGTYQTIRDLKDSTRVRQMTGAMAADDEAQS